MAILSNRDGNLSSIHRYLVNHNTGILTSINYSTHRPISRSQLPNVLQNVCLEIFEGILFTNFGIILSTQERQWFALDGKDLKGSIETGHTRGEAIVQAVTHEHRVVQSQHYYSGRKQSEVITVQNILKDNNLQSQKISMDALHCKPHRLESIHESGGVYLVGLKDNQKELLSQCVDVTRFSKPSFNFIQADYNPDTSIKPKHGRIEKRVYQVYDISKEENHKRWSNCKINTLIRVKRDIRGYWAVEVKSRLIITFEMLHSQKIS